MRRLKFLFLFLHLSVALSAQEMWGISNSNFSGNMGKFLNPTIIVGAPFQYEINLVAYDQFAENTFLYFPVEYGILTDDHTTKLTQGVNYFGSGTQNGFSHQLILGPAYIHNFKTHAWGIHCAFRSETSILKMNSGLVSLLNDDFNSPQLNGNVIDAAPFTSVNASWFEIGGTYGKIYRENEKNIIKWAANINLIGGLHGYTYESRAMSFTPIDSSEVVLHNIDASYRYTSNESLFALNGIGLSTTLGVAYIKDPNRGAFDCNMSNDRLKKYRYRLGLSIIDLGLIQFFNNSYNYSVTSTNNYSWNGVDTLKIPSLQSLDTTLTNHVGGFTEEKGFGIWLPMAISMQFDYQLRQNLFANASIVNRLRLFENQVVRGNQFNGSIRYEKRRYEAALNFTLFEYKQPSLGLGLRYRFLVVGTDRLLQFFDLSESKAFDFFFGIKFQFCKRPFSPGPDCPAYLGY